jgi:RHS repeat-associated protein
MEDGNGIRTKYDYDAADRRLANLKAGSFQNLSYIYDEVGNITDLLNEVPVPPSSGIGGPVTQHFDYDGLYRLTNASGNWTTPGGKTSSYTLAMDYDRIHNIKNKNQEHTLSSSPNNEIVQKETTYTFDYAYTGSQPHAPTRIGDRTYTYDANGNQTGWEDVRNGQRRSIVWDEENRIQSISDNGMETTYKYNDTGERVIKRTGQGETAYINQFWTARNRSDSTKHIFVGATRIASKLGSGNENTEPATNAAAAKRAEAASPVTAQQAAEDLQGPSQIPSLPEGVFLYFYHPDHLGSTSYVTDNLGEVFEHVQYFPFGETWAHEDTNVQRTPYLFTSKELDEETQLYYFGARYYDPKTSVWQSADPALPSYLAAKSDGVYNPMSLDSYGYGHRNPLRFVDPEGRQAEETGRNVAETFRQIENELEYAEYERHFKLNPRARLAKARKLAQQLPADPTDAEIEPVLKMYENVTFDAKTEKMLGQMHPQARRRARAHIHLLRRFGVKTDIRDAYRTYERQDGIYAQGRTKPGKIVTTVRGGESFHNFGLAYDLTLGKQSDYGLAASLGKGLGFEWGGDWTDFVDIGHFQFTGGLDKDTIRTRWNVGMDVFKPVHTMLYVEPWRPEL